MPLDQLWALGAAWYDDRLQLEWARRTIDERAGILKAVGLTGDFWRLD